MKITLFGASGRTGGHVLKLALEKGHEITAFVRNSNKLNMEHKNLSICQGDAFNTEDVEKAVKGADAVLGTIGTTSRAESTTVSRAMENIIKAMEKHGVKRIISLSTMGAGESMDYIGLVWRIFLKLLLSGPIRDHERHEDLIRASSLDWTIIRPGALLSKPGTGRYTVGYNLGTGRICREDLAEFMVKQLETEEYLKMTPSIINVQ
ncbi:NAD(P)-dependent oxidoreductase [Spirochaetota bacterium]